ncbi:hypothetical protein ACHQM5_028011 [Ranunculus cassubicifolius]
MEGCSSIKAVQVVPIAAKTQWRDAHTSFVKVGFSKISWTSTFQSQVYGKAFRHTYARSSCKASPLFAPVAKYTGVGTPFEPISAEGRLLSCVLQNKQHLFQFAVDEQLDQLVSERDEVVDHETESLGSMEQVLHRRIAEVKENERRIAVEDVMYMSVVYKFSEVGVPMVQELSKCLTNNTLEICPSKCRELESIHSLDAQDMIKEHVTRILRARTKSMTMDGVITTEIDRIHLGQIYAASVMYGCFLKSICSRRKMDFGLLHSAQEYWPYALDNLVTLGKSENTQVASFGQESHDARRENQGSYAMSFDSRSLQGCAKLKSKEAVNVIEKHTWGLFGDEKIGEFGFDNKIVITFPSLERLVLEATAFGSFLWEVEKSVDSVYSLNSK